MTTRAPQRRQVDPRTGRLYRVSGVARAMHEPPSAVRRAKLDNLALVPGSLLPYKDVWQQLANELPEGTTLIILPTAAGSTRRALERFSSALEARGRKVATLSADRLPYPVKPEVACPGALIAAPGDRT